MRSKLIRVNRETGAEIEIAVFLGPGDAMWAATLFQSHKVYGKDFNHYVRHGKKIMVPAAAISAGLFNTI